MCLTLETKYMTFKGRDLCQPQKYVEHMPLDSANIIYSVNISSTNIISVKPLKSLSS